jgi:hypothetical protein
MKNIVRAAVVAVALIATAPAVANATAFITIDPAAANGSISGVFGNTGIGLGSFTDTLTFPLPTTGLTSATITSIMTSATNDVTFTSVLLNGVALGLGTTGVTEFRFLNNLSTVGGIQTLTISGTSGGEGSYGGTIAFSPGAVPELATWAMMILGFGMVGVGMRFTRRVDTGRIAA